MAGFARTLLAVPMLGLCLAAAGCAGRAAAPVAAAVPPDELLLPQEAVPPGVRPMSREVEDMGSQ